MFSALAESSLLWEFSTFVKMYAVKSCNCNNFHVLKSKVILFLLNTPNSCSCLKSNVLIL